MRNLSKSFRINLLEKNPTCLFCHDKANIIHHLDKNRKNNSLDNLIAVCKSCHRLYFHPRNFFSSPIKKMSRNYLFFNLSKKESTDSEILQDLIRN